jgi:hypothetical protein
MFNIQLTPLQPPELGGGIGFRITVRPGKYIDLSLVTGTATSPSRLYRVRAQVVSFIAVCNKDGDTAFLGPNQKIKNTSL